PKQKGKYGERKGNNPSRTPGVLFKPLHNGRHISFKPAGDEKIKQADFLIATIPKIMVCLGGNPDKSPFIRCNPSIAYEKGSCSFQDIKYFIIMLMLVYTRPVRMGF